MSRVDEAIIKTLGKNPKGLGPRLLKELAGLQKVNDKNYYGHLKKLEKRGEIIKTIGPEKDGKISIIYKPTKGRVSIDSVEMKERGIFYPYARFDLTRFDECVFNSKEEKEIKRPGRKPQREKLKRSVIKISLK
jgi:DNA-binding MarR family transcriptional regulator